MDAQIVAAMRRIVANDHVKFDLRPYRALARSGVIALEQAARRYGDLPSARGAPRLAVDHAPRSLQKAVHPAHILASHYNPRSESTEDQPVSRRCVLKNAVILRRACRVASSSNFVPETRARKRSKRVTSAGSWSFMKPCPTPG